MRRKNAHAGASPSGWPSARCSRCLCIIRLISISVQRRPVGWPLPVNLGDLLRSFGTIIVPEMNTGQLKTVLRDSLRA